MAVQAVKKGILAVSFGTTYDLAREEAIEALERDWEEAFPDYTLRRAFTSSIVRKKLAGRGIRVPGVSQALEELKRDGYTHIWIQPTHLIPGEEYDRLRAEAARWQEQFPFLKTGEPLLLEEEDYDMVVGLMQDRFRPGEGEACIFMGHGTYHQANRVYEKIEKRLETEGGNRFFMATVEGVPSLEEILDGLESDPSIQKIRLVPFMLVAGEHALHDMAGGEKESWKNRCRARGYEVDCVLHGMGAWPEIRELYQRKCRKCLSGIFYGISVGPGAGGSLTLDGADCIRRCEVLAVPRTGMDHTIALSIVRKAGERIREIFGGSREDFLGLDEKELLYMDILMTRDETKRSQVYEELAEKIAFCLQAGKNVGMIVLGDVSVYATVSYLTAPLKRRGYGVKLLPGVSSFCACAAALGRSLTSMSSPLHILPAGYEGLKESLELPGSKVLMKSGKYLPEAKRMLREAGLYETAAMVKDCGMDTEEICWSLDEDTQRASYFTTILVPGQDTDAGQE